MGADFIPKPGNKSKICDNSLTETDCKVKTHIDVINTRLAELAAYAVNNISINDRIGKNFRVESDSNRDKIAQALNDVLTNYINVYNIISSDNSFTTLEKDLAQKSLNKRISNYVTVLLDKNNSGEFSKDSREVKILISSLQNEQRYFSRT